MRRGLLLRVTESEDISATPYDWEAKIAFLVKASKMKEPNIPERREVRSECNIFGLFFSKQLLILKFPRARGLRSYSDNG